MKKSSIKNVYRIFFPLLMTFAPFSTSATGMLGMLQTALLGGVMLTQHAHGIPEVVSIHNISTEASNHGYLLLNSTGLPVIAYPKSNQLELASCDDFECVNVTYQTLASFSSGYQVNDVALQFDQNQDPIVSFTAFSGAIQDVHVFPCDTCSSFPCTSGGNSQCMKWSDTFTLFAHFTSLQIKSNNKPIITFYTYPNLTFASGPCEVVGSFYCPKRKLIAPGGKYSYMKLTSDGNPIIAHYLSGLLYVTVCQDANCDTVFNTPSIDGVFGAPGTSQTSLQLNSSNHSRISYAGSDYKLKIAACDDVECTSVTINVVDETSSANPIGALSSLQLQKDTEYPIISYLSGYSSENKLNLAICHDIYCEGSVTIVDDIDSGLNNQRATFLQLTDDGQYAVISYVVAFGGFGGTQVLKVATVNLNPTAMPTTADPTTADPTTADPTTADPTTADPTTADPTTADPTTAYPTTAEPSKYPTKDPSIDPTREPSMDPTNDPTMDPTRDPTAEPTNEPTVEPTNDPLQIFIIEKPERESSSQESKDVFENMGNNDWGVEEVLTIIGLTAGAGVAVIFVMAFYKYVWIGMINTGPTPPFTKVPTGTTI